MAFTKEHARQNREIRSLARCILKRQRYPSEAATDWGGMWNIYSITVANDTITEIRSQVPDVSKDRISSRVFREMSNIIHRPKEK